MYVQSCFVVKLYAMGVTKSGIAPTKQSPRLWRGLLCWWASGWVADQAARARSALAPRIRVGSFADQGAVDGMVAVRAQETHAVLANSPCITLADAL